MGVFIGVSSMWSSWSWWWYGVRGESCIAGKEDWKHDKTEIIEGICVVKKESCSGSFLGYHGSEVVVKREETVWSWMLQWMVVVEVERLWLWWR